ncbi:MAG: DUF1848 domain-containing protein [Candidatus Pacearchaeota archaeon]|nr:DUF1848 domain-containing protein [Candidatus Pacearchaeota archaeon]
MSRKNWPKISLTCESGETVSAIAPYVISASRATDIPACCGEWFLEQLQRGYTTWINPFNGKTTYVSFENTRLFAFWTKNPQPFLDVLKILDQKDFSYFFQFTINDYEEENYEKLIPPLSSRIETLKRLSDSIGREKILWRFDPLILTDTLNAQMLLSRIENLGDRISRYVSRLTISFLTPYKTVISRMRRSSVIPRNPDLKELRLIGEGCMALGNKWGIEVVSCAETEPLQRFGIPAGSCIDPVYILKYFSRDGILTEFIHSYCQPTLFDDIQHLREACKDPGQRKECLCMQSKDIGKYGTCRQECMYCYAKRKSRFMNEE